MPETPEPLEVEYRPLDALIPYARNSRTHSDAQVAQIAASIREFGFTNPVLVDASGGIIAGHGRVLAARQLGLDVVPTIALGHLTETQRRAYVIADNKLALNAAWDEEALRLEIVDLGYLDFDPALLGFEAGELVDLMRDDALPVQPDRSKDVDASNKWLLLIEYPDENALASAYEAAKQEGLPCKLIQ